MGESLHNDKIYVAVSQDVGESRKTLEWTLKNLPVKKICLLHVHVPFSLTSSSSRLNENEINAIQESEVKDSYDSLYKYRDICTKNGVNENYVDISCISGYGVGERIVELINQNNITKLVMGAAADSHYSRGMSITSRKAEYVSQHAPHFCKMWFICKGKLIKTKEGSFGIANPLDSFLGLYGSPQEPSQGRRTKGSPKKTRNESEPCPPQEYICPISMDLMRDPHVAADGHIYEGEKIKDWLKINPTSPITRAKLDQHNLTPDYTLRSLIQDWLHKHPNYNID